MLVTQVQLSTVKRTGGLLVVVVEAGAAAGAAEGGREPWQEI